MTVAVPNLRTTIPAQRLAIWHGFANGHATRAHRSHRHNHAIACTCHIEHLTRPCRRAYGPEHRRANPSSLRVTRMSNGDRLRGVSTTDKSPPGKQRSPSAPATLSTTSQQLYRHRELACCMRPAPTTRARKINGVSAMSAIQGASTGWIEARAAQGRSQSMLTTATATVTFL